MKKALLPWGQIKLQGHLSRTDPHCDGLKKLTPCLPMYYTKRVSDTTSLNGPAHVIMYLSHNYFNSCLLVLSAGTIVSANS